MLWNQSVRFYLFLALSIAFHLIVVSSLPRLSVSEALMPVWVSLMDVKENVSYLEGVTQLKGGLPQGAFLSGKAHIIERGKTISESKTPSPTKFSVGEGFKRTEQKVRSRDVSNAFREEGRLNKEASRENPVGEGERRGPNQGIREIPVREGKDSTASKEERLMPPELVNPVEIGYPLVARKMRYEGSVLLEIEVLEDGSVGEVRLIESSKYEVLDRAAIAGVKKWKFLPAKYDGKPVKSWVRKRIDFKLRS